VGSVGARGRRQAETLQPEVVLRRGTTPAERAAATRITSARERHEGTHEDAASTLHQVKGTVKTVGRATNNPDLEAEGQAEKIGGSSKKIGHVKVPAIG
jgi:uncharacterized protein YjbJ (UPF0337 family)